MCALQGGGTFEQNQQGRPLEWNAHIFMRTGKFRYCGYSTNTTVGELRMADSSFFGAIFRTPKNTFSHEQRRFAHPILRNNYAPSRRWSDGYYDRWVFFAAQRIEIGLKLYCP